MFVYQNQILNASENLLNMQVVRSGMIYLIIYRMHPQAQAFKYAYKNLNFKHRNTH